jgi:Phage major capsid protein E
MMLNIFGSDAFEFTKLIGVINSIPYAPTRLGSLGYFKPDGISTLTAAFELQGNTLTLVPSAARGAPGVAKNLDRRSLKDFRTTHLPQRVAVQADEVLGLRALGSETEEELAMNLLRKKAAVARRDLDITHEWQRMGALKGQVLDADGSSVLYNFLTEFGVSQSTLAFNFSSGATYAVLQRCLELKRQIEDKLGGVFSSGVRVLCSKEFFDAFTGHAAVVEAYKYQQSSFMRSDNRDGFVFGGITWEEYRGSVGGTRFIAANEAYAVPEGVDGLMQTLYSPAPYMETVNTMGLPFYMKAKNMDYDTGVEWQVQSNPLHICTRPDAVFKLTAT